MTKIVNLNFQQLINGWEIEIIDGDKTIEFSSEETEKQLIDDNYQSLHSLLSDMSYELNKEYWEKIEDDEEDDHYDFDYDEDAIIIAVKKFFNDDALEINIRCSQDDT